MASLPSRSRPLEYLCRSGKHCIACRDTSPAGERWRQSAVGVYDVPRARWECPEGLPWGLETAPARAGTPLQRQALSPLDLMRRDGPALWREIHTREKNDAGWLATIAGRLPCGACRADWIAYVAANPPDFGEEWALWTWRAHNAVNEKLGKPEMPLEEFRRLYPN
jgi:hypothetical protein